MWKEDYYNTLNKTLEYFNIKYSENDILDLKKAISHYEKEYNIYNEQYMLKTLKKYAKLELPDKFVSTWIEYLKDCYPKQKDEDLINILDYLSKKYELVVLTNWFTEQQKERLSRYGILKYFKEVIGTDIILNKPNKEAFIYACGKNSVNDCIMIGDNFEIDIMGSYESGLEAIWLNKNNLQLKQKIKVLQINNLIELKKYL